MDSIKLYARAKVNLLLDVVRKREDGYHDVKMIMQTINLSDKIILTKSNKRDIQLKTNLSYLPVNENNLVYKAVNMMNKEFGIEEGTEVELLKNIPVAAGMAGGSTDAAAALVGMNRLYKLGLSRKQLMERGVLLGADVPYCILRGTAISEGIGEVLTALPPVPNCTVLIAKPGISVSTKFVYENLNISNINVHPDMDGMIKAIEVGNLKVISEKLENVLETVTIEKYPIIEDIKRQMKKDGALNAIMSGSGPTVFGLFEDFEKGKYAYDKLRKGKLAKQVYLTSFFNPLKR